MKKVMLALTRSVLASAQALPPAPAPAALAAYWRSVAEHFAAIAAFEAYLTPEQKAARRSMEDVDKRLAEARAKLAASCGKGYTLDESGAEPTCRSGK